MTDVHSCSYYCDRPECIKAQRDELRDRLVSMTDRELMQQALDALEANLGNWAAKTKAIAALRERLAQPEQEPIKESSVTHSHLWISELWRKEKNA